MEGEHRARTNRLATRTRRLQVGRDQSGHGTINRGVWLEPGESRVLRAVPVDLIVPGLVTAGHDGPVSQPHLRCEIGPVGGGTAQFSREVVRGGIEPPTPRFSGTQFDANWAKYGELREMAVAEAIVGWTDLDGNPVRAVAARAAPGSGSWRLAAVGWSRSSCSRSMSGSRSVPGVAVLRRTFSRPARTAYTERVDLIRSVTLHALLERAATPIAGSRRRHPLALAVASTAYQTIV